MARRLTRQEMKRDEVMEGLEAIFITIQENLRTILMTIAGVVVLALVGVGVLMYMNARQAEAAELLADAIEVYGAPLAGEAAAPGELTFPDAETRRTRARSLFEGIVDGYRGTPSGRVARVYLADIAIDEGRTDEARAIWAELADDGDDLLSAEMTLNVIQLDREAGLHEEVEARLRAMLVDSDAALPTDVVLRELAVTLKAMGRDEESNQIYQRIVDEHPGSPYFAEASSAVGGGGALPTFPGLVG